MNKNVGLWIDHERAVIVSVSDQGEDIKHVSAAIKKPHSGNSVPADDIRQRVITGHLNKYYDGVIACIGDADAIFLIGPGEAKGELHKRLDKAKFGELAIKVEPADKMTDPQIVATIREHFFSGAPTDTIRSRPSIIL